MKRILILTVMVVMVLFAKQANSQDFESYWKQFKSAVKGDDINAVTNLTNFPFVYGWLNPSEDVSINDFKLKSYIPSIEILNLARINQEVETKKDKDGFAKSIALRIDGDDYVLSFTDWNDAESYGSWSDYYFKIFGGEFKYYKLIQGD